MASDFDKRLNALLRDPELKKAIDAAITKKGLRVREGALDLEDARQNTLLALAMFWREQGLPVTAKDAIPLAVTIAGRTASGVWRKRFTQRDTADDQIDERGGPGKQDGVDPIDANAVLGLTMKMRDSGDLNAVQREVLDALILGYSQKEVAEATKRPYASVRKDREALAAAVGKRAGLLGIANIGIAKLAAYAAVAAVAAAFVAVFYRLLSPAPAPLPPRVAVDAEAPAPSVSAPPPMLLVDNHPREKAEALVAEAAREKAAKHWRECSALIGRAKDAYLGPLPDGGEALAHQCEEEILREGVVKFPPAPPKPRAVKDAGARDTGR